MTDDDKTAGSVQRAFAILRALASTQAKGGRITDIAKATGLTQATTHRLLQSLVTEQVVAQDPASKLYRLSIDFFALAAQAGNAMDLRSLCRPSMLRLCASLGDTIFLLVRSGFDAVCLDRSEVIRYNLPRVREYGVYDEVYLRTEIERVRQLGYAGRNTNLLDGMAGVGVPVLDREGRAVAALSVGTISSRLSPDRLPTVVELLKREATAIGAQINPFDKTLRRPAQSLAPSDGA
jgi:DNA-binding IclR family transcriptional regulator